MLNEEEEANNVMVRTKDSRMLLYETKPNSLHTEPQKQKDEEKKKKNKQMKEDESNES